MNYDRSMPEDLKLSQIGSSQLRPPFRGLHSPGVKKKPLSNYLCLLFPEIVYCEQILRSLFVNVYTDLLIVMLLLGVH